MRIFSLWGLIASLLVISVLLIINFDAYQSASQPKDYLPILLSSISIVISLLVAFRNEIFPLIIKARTGDILLYSRRGLASAKDFILVISFLNPGYVDTEVEYVCVEVTDPHKKKRVYQASLEVEEVLFESVRVGLSPPDRKGREFSFFSFPLKARTSVRKFLSLQYEDQDVDSLNWVEGKYHFRVLVKVWQFKKLREIATFSHHLDQGTLMTMTAQSAYLIKSRISPVLDRQIKKIEGGSWWHRIRH